MLPEAAQIPHKARTACLGLWTSFKVSPEYNFKPATAKYFRRTESQLSAYTDHQTSPCIIINFYPKIHNTDEQKSVCWSCCFLWFTLSFHAKSCFSEIGEGFYVVLNHFEPAPKINHSLLPKRCLKLCRMYIEKLYYHLFSHFQHF